ncbi:hypothetical protein [Yersinia aldovae]|uniref:hypothetical protein n=1 Tax=Yersinia aldovae TaxID=29483 RepID=UPI0005AC7C14|nr:hypothetical protein [Yersinia aldovae]AJJ64987.1 hypothetical protein AT01_1122 [Yersinia aldovae 670-83]
MPNISPGCPQSPYVDGPRYAPETVGTQVLAPTLMAPGSQITSTENPISESRRLERRAHTFYFIQHLVRFSMSAISFGLAVAAAVLSGGAGIPIAVVAGAAMIIAAGDAGCALYNMIQVRNDRQPLVTNNDCIVLAVKELMEHCGCSSQHSENIADGTSFVIRAGVALSAALFPQLLPAAHLSGSTAEILGDISAGATASLTVVGAMLDMHTARVERRQKTVVTTAVQTEEDESKVSDEKIQEWITGIINCYQRHIAQPQRFQSHI